MIRIFADKDVTGSRERAGRIQIRNGRRLNVRRLVAYPDPGIIFYHGPEEKNLNDIVSKISEKGLVKNDRIAAAKEIMNCIHFHSCLESRESRY